MSRRPNAARRLADGGSIPFVGGFHSKAHPSPLLSIGIFVVGALLVVGYLYHNSGGRSGDISALSRLDGISCTLEVQKLIPILKKTYGDSMKKVLHVGPETCSVVSQLLKEEDTEAWGVEPYELDDADASCKSLVHRGIIRVADIKFPLPYRPKSFSLVIVSDALDYLSPKYLNKTVPELARVSSDGLVILSGYPGQQRAKVSELSKFGRPAKLRSSSWWIRFFIQTSLEENESAVKKFEQAASKKSFKSACQQQQRMGALRVPILLVCLIMASSHHIHGQNGPQDFVDAHNAARAEVGVPGLVWNNTLAVYAQAYAHYRSKDCAMQHSESTYGENLAAGDWDVSAEEAVNMWVEEKSSYNVSSNTCLRGDDQCLHYTQVVWRSSARVGCARARCSDGWTFVSCNYDPPGNFVGEPPF
ncbi:transmembrane protein [Perilla frutescens var. frutescens]|nr:transmembrane protein [Perilla frutescens var. frutescens]